MSLLIFFPALLVFIYSLYRQVKDDYFLIRKNISTEDILDMVVVVLFVSLISSRLFFFFMYHLLDKKALFSFQAGEFSLLGLVLGGMGGLYLVGKYKKLPIIRLFDFFTASFVVSLPIGFFSVMIFSREYLLLVYFLNALIYSVFAFYFLKYFRFKPSVFVLYFSFVSLANNLVLQVLNKGNFINIENIILVMLIIFGLIFFFRNK